MDSDIANSMLKHALEQVFLESVFNLTSEMQDKFPSISLPRYPRFPSLDLYSPFCWLAGLRLS